MNRNGCVDPRSTGATRLQWWVSSRTQAGTSSRQVLSVRTCPLPCPVSHLAGSQAPPARVPTHSILTHPPSLACFTPRNSPRTSLSQCATNLASASCLANRASSQPQVPCDASCSTCSFPCPRSWPRPWRKNTSHLYSSPAPNQRLSSNCSRCTDALVCRSLRLCGCTVCATFLTRRTQPDARARPARHVTAHQSLVVVCYSTRTCSIVMAS
jgi:hypothetical protein